MSNSTTRRGFMSQVGKTLLVGAGTAAALPVLADRASASPRNGPASPNSPLTVSYRCCANPVRCGTCTQHGQSTFYCTSSSCPNGAYCLGCRTFVTDCFTQSQLSCI